MPALYKIKIGDCYIMWIKIAVVIVVVIFFQQTTIVYSQTQKEKQEYPEYNLPHTEIRELGSKITGIKYILYVSLPRQYDKEIQDYPIIYTLDADYSFALAHNTIEHFADRKDLPSMIIVSIAYEGASQDMYTYRYNRIRDYTPVESYIPFEGYNVISKKVSGGGKKFKLFIIQELIPFIDANYRAKKNDRTIVGHSMGGLFGAYMLFTKPEIFQKYILVSPSLWYADDFIFQLEKLYSSSHNKLDATIFISIGNLEPMWFMGHDRFVKQLQRRKYKNLKLIECVFDNETHNSIFPAALSRGLREVFSSSAGR